MLKTKTSFSRIIGLTMAFLMILSCMPVMNAEAKMTTGTNSFYEDFEGYSETATVGATSINYNGWTTTHIAGTASAGYKKLSTVSSENAAKGNALQIDHTVAGTSIIALGKSAGVTIGSDDIIISGDVYIPEETASTNKQFVRFYVARGTAHNTPSFGFYITKFEGAEGWRLRQVAPTSKEGAKEDKLKDKTGFDHELDLTENTWYNLACVYHPATKSVDYYVDGTYFGSTDTLAYNNAGEECEAGGYQVLDNNVGGSLGDIVLSIGANELGTDATAAKFDNISVTTASASNVRYSDIENGSSYLNAHFDIPVSEATIADANITVKKMAADDVTFSGANATTVTGYTVNYKDAGGVGIEFDSALTGAYDRYQVKVTGMTDIFGNSATAVQNYTVGDAMVQKGTTGTLTFDSSTLSFTEETTSKTTISHDSTEQALKIGVNTRSVNKIWDQTAAGYNGAYNVSVDQTVEYMDACWDLKATYGTNGASTEYKTMFSIMTASPNQAHVGVVIYNNQITLAKAGPAEIATYKCNTGITENTWTSYKLRYYPWTGKVEVYTAASQAALASATPVLTVTDAANFAWPASVSRIRAFQITPVTAGSVTLFDNFNLTTYGYSAVSYEIAQQQTFSETFNSGANNWMSVNGAEYATVDYDSESQAIEATAAKRNANNIIRRYATADVDNNNYCNIAVNDAVEYMDVSWDIKATYGNSEQAESYKTWFEILTGTNSAQAVKVGLNVQNNLLQILGSGHAGGTSDSTKGISENTWTSYKLRYYPWTGKVEVYTAASQAALASTTEPVLTQTADTYKWSTTDNGTRIFGFQFIPINNGSVTLFDNFSVTTYGYSLTGATVKAATFEDKNGNVLDNKPGAKTIKLHLDNAETAPTATLDGATLTGTLADGVYTATLGNMLLGNETYTLSVNGTDYTFTTGDGEFKVSNLRFVDGSDAKLSNPLVNGDVFAAVDVFNSTNVSETAYLIWAAYDGSELKSTKFTQISAAGGFDQTVEGEALTVTDDYTKVKAFLWDGFTTLVPLLGSETLTKAAN